MVSQRAKTALGLALIAVGLVQVASFAWNSNLGYSVSGLLYVGMGAAFLWAEVYTTSA
ncbi:hypothetical protein PNP59_10600 [Halobacterium salinarum]|uniref:Uncharacterized protein n=3 Tax=Halobacterium salinarum TaxID=2242 RepID=Q9HQV4_HALSA|nr:hypothetical protein [Halobacterium salinarum]AAG19407.1 hypothetical protein VNG_0990H [Halobacterium salinarum NRC-1]MBB6090089.1 hypothetical protein [Halobacterium salinarum]MDL0131378.1 hypothetical protein [Halobacterium salinarum]CAP13682.1 uncharacterized protein OE_2440F [Halobacterium salinarum R1]DAC78116.1 TPA_inf: uncharacterized protein VNG_0990H [Halobacterium salinarum NRC-1]